MKIPLNLASKPYENLRPYYTLAGVAALALVALAAMLLWKERQVRHETRFQTEQIRLLEQGLADLRREQRELDQLLARPEVEETRYRSAFLNSLIVRKSLSWTQLFLDIEKILPARAQITAIHPGLNASRQAELKLTVTAAEMGPLVELLKNAEASSQFGSPVVESQRFSTDRNAGGRVTLELSMQYQQSLPDLTASPEQEAAAQRVETASARTGVSREPEKGGTR